MKRVIISVVITARIKVQKITVAKYGGVIQLDFEKKLSPLF